MDVSHFPFVHANILGDPAFPEQEPYELHEGGVGTASGWTTSSTGRWTEHRGAVSYEYYHWYPFTMHIRILEENGNDTVITVTAIAHGGKADERVPDRAPNYVNTDPRFVEDYLFILDQDRAAVERSARGDPAQPQGGAPHQGAGTSSSIAFRRRPATVDSMGVAPP